MFKDRKRLLKSETFGDLVYWGTRWESVGKTTISLWGRDFSIGLEVVASTQ